MLAPALRVAVLLVDTAQGISLCCQLGHGKTVSLGLDGYGIVVFEGTLNIEC